MAEEPIIIDANYLAKIRAEKKADEQFFANVTFELANKVVKNVPLTNAELARLIRNGMTLEGVGTSESNRSSYEMAYHEKYQFEMDQHEITGIQPDSRLYRPSLAALEAALKFVSTIDEVKVE